MRRDSLRWLDEVEKLNFVGAQGVLIDVVRDPGGDETTVTIGADGQIPQLAAAEEIALGRRIRDKFDPTKIAGVVGWWRADDLVGADGSAVAAWPDRIAGITLVQAVGANQPLLKKAANGIGGRNTVLFSAAGPQYLQLGAVPASIPKSGPFTVIVVTNPAPNGAYQAAISYNATAIGWSVGIGNQNGPWLSRVGLSDVKSGHQVTGVLSYVITAQINADGTFTFTQNNTYPAEAIAGPSTVNQVPDTLTIGANKAAANGYNAKISEILIVNRDLGVVERTLLARYLGAYYGLKVGTLANAAVKDAIPVPVGNDGSVTEPSVIRDVTGRGVAGTGKKYAMGFVTYDNILSIAELPNFVVSDDGANWAAPPGLVNPITPVPSGGGHLADSRIRLSPDGSKVNFIYIRQGTVADGIVLRTTYDGVSWTPEQLIIAINGDAVIEPMPVWDGDRWVMFTVNNLVTPQFIEMRQTSDPTMVTGWTAPVRVNFAKPANAIDQTAFWHGDAFFLNGVYYLALSDGGAPVTTVRAIWVGGSVDAVNFDVRDQPILTGSFIDAAAQQWDGAQYRACFQLSDSGRNLLTWYSGFNNNLDAGQHFIGHSSVPVSELP